MLAADIQLTTVDCLIRQFIQLVKEQRDQDLDQWLTAVAASGIKAVKSFAQGLRVDFVCRSECLEAELE